MISTGTSIRVREDCGGTGGCRVAFAMVLQGFGSLSAEVLSLSGQGAALSNWTELLGAMHMGMKVIRRRIYLDHYKQHSISIQGEIDKCYRFRQFRSVFGLQCDYSKTPQNTVPDSHT